MKIPAQISIPTKYTKSNIDNIMVMVKKCYNYKKITILVLEQ